MVGASVIDDYVADLDSRLRGDRRTKVDLLTEARDSLHDAAECYREAGFCEDTAQRKAISDFGPAGTIARSYQGELAAAYGARTLRSILFMLPLVHLIWEGTRMLWYGPWENFPGSPPPAWYYPFAQLNDSTNWAVAVAAALALLGGRLMARRVSDCRFIARCAAGVALTAVGASILATGALMVATIAFEPARIYNSPPLFMASLVALAVLSRLAIMARRTARFCV
ncbi:MAG: permease prefix domain 1-containing protein [Kibdelosporangium sp.]